MPQAADWTMGVEITDITNPAQQQQAIISFTRHILNRREQERDTLCAKINQELRQAGMRTARFFRDHVGGSAARLEITYPTWQEVTKQILWKEVIQRSQNRGQGRIQQEVQQHQTGMEDMDMMGLAQMVSMEEQERQRQAIANGPCQQIAELAQVEPSPPELDAGAKIIVRIRLPMTRSVSVEAMIKDVAKAARTAVGPGKLEFYPGQLIAFYRCTVEQATWMLKDEDFKKTYTIIPWKEDPTPNCLYGLSLFGATPVELQHVQVWWCGQDEICHRWGDVAIKGPHES